MANKKKMVGVMVPHWEYGLGGDTPRGSDVLDFAKNAESLGMDSIWVVDHLVMDQGEYASFVGIEPGNEIARAANDKGGFAVVRD